MANGDSGATGILGVVVGVIVVLALLYFVFGEQIGIRSASGPSTSVTVNAPKAPVKTQ